jgi:hypothetical protein
MKTKNMIAAASAAIIGGSLFYYYLSRRSKNKNKTATAERVVRSGEERIRKVMHQAKEIRHTF